VKNSKVSIVFANDLTGRIDSDAGSINNKYVNPIFGRLENTLDNNMELLFKQKSPLRHYVRQIGKKVAVIRNIRNNTEILTEKIIEMWDFWMKRFKGVSTKYLSNYLHWYDFLENSRHKRNAIISFIHLIL
jgi:hypothetical protein